MATFDGIAVPYGTTIEVGGISETFARGAIDPASVVGLPILWQHDSGSVAGVIRKGTNTDDGLRVSGDLIATSVGRDADAVLRSGAEIGLSVGFEPVADTWDGSHVTRTEVRLRELSIATFPAYEDARVLAIRQEAPVPETVTTGCGVVSSPPEQIPDYVTRADLGALEARMSTLSAPPPARLEVVPTLIRQLDDAVANRQLRALADVLSSGNAGILPPVWASEVLGYIDSTRYLIPRTGSVPFPTTGSTITFPRITQNTLVGPRGTEKTDIPSRALTTTGTPYTAAWYAGGDDIALELIEQSSPSVLGIVVQNLFQQYALVTDKAVTLAAETAASPVGAVLDFTSYKTFVTQVTTQSEAIRVVTGLPGNRLSLTPTSWGKLISLTDTTGRRILSDTGATNADGAVDLVTPFVDVGGIVCFFNPNAVEDMQYNESALRVAEKPPVQLTVTNVSKMGQDVGILGAVIVLPLYPTALKVYSLTLREAKK